MQKIAFKRLLYRLRHDYLTLNNIVIAAAFLIALSWAWGSVEVMQRNYQLQQSVDSKRRQVEIEKLRVSLLTYEEKYYQSDEYIDLAVRQRLGLGAPGEQQLITPSTDTAAPSAARPAQHNQANYPRSNLQQWLDFLFGGRRHK